MSHVEYRVGDRVRLIEDQSGLSGIAEYFAGRVVKITEINGWSYTAEFEDENEFLGPGETMILNPSEIEGLARVPPQATPIPQKMIVLTLSDFQVTEDDSITVRQLREAEEAVGRWNAPRTSPSFFVDATREGALRKALAWWLTHDNGRVAGLLTGRISEAEWDMENPFPKAMLTSDERVTVGERP